MSRSFALRSDECAPKVHADPRCKRIIARRKFHRGDLKPFTPDLRPAIGVDKSCAEQPCVARASDFAFGDIAYVDFAADRARIDLLSFVQCDKPGRCYSRGPRDAPECGGYLGQEH